MKLNKLISFFFGFVGVVYAEPPLMPVDYYAEPAGLPFAETIQQEKKETGWKWTEFRYTSIVYEGQPMRIHAVYAVPDSASATHKVPVIVMTHGKFGEIMKIDVRFPAGNEPGKPVNPTAIPGFSGGGFGPPRRTDPRYLDAVRDLVAAGYAVIYFEWNPDPAIKAGPLAVDAPEPSYSTFGTLDFSKDWMQSGNDWRDGLFYQTMMAGRRAITWVEARPEVDATRIGATGASYGGIFSSLLAAIDLRIKAVAPTVYSGGFGIGEPSYNNLALGKFTPSQAQEWKARFDPEVLLNRRSVALPILYLVGSSDAAFWITKTSRHYQALPEPKQILIAPNQGHGFWNFAQTVRFFDRELQHKGTQPKIESVLSAKEQDGWKFSVKSNTAPVEFFYAVEPLHDMTLREDRRSDPSKWKWERLVATSAEPDAQTYTTTLVLSAEVRAQTQAVRVFARTKNVEGTEAGSPLLTLSLVSETK